MLKTGKRCNLQAKALDKFLAQELVELFYLDLLTDNPCCVIQMSGPPRQSGNHRPSSLRIVRTRIFSFFGSFFDSGASKRKTSGANCRLATSTSPRYTASLINCGPYRAGWPMIERAFWRWLEPSRIESFAGPYTIYSKSTPPRARSGLTQAAAVRLQLDLYQ